MKNITMKLSIMPDSKPTFLKALMLSDQIEADTLVKNKVMELVSMS